MTTGRNSEVYSNGTTNFEIGRSNQVRFITVSFLGKKILDVNEKRFSWIPVDG